MILTAPIFAFGQMTNALRKPVSIEIDGYAAKVNNRVITIGEVNDALTPLLPELYRQFKGDQLKEELDKAFDKARDQLIERALIMEAFTAKGGQIPDQYVNENIKSEINQRYKGDEALFEQMLAQQKKTRAEYMENVREQMAVGMLTNEEVGRRARVTPEQVREAYEQNREMYYIPEKVKYSIIVLNKGTTPDDQAVKREEADTIRRRLLDGADFGETATEVSEGSRAADGGAFPWMQPKDVRPELQDTLRTLPAGEISEIIETEQQLYIVKVEARRQPGYKTFDEVRLDLKNALTAKERQRLHERWIDRLKENSYIQIYD
ncbi:Chaperone SurA [Pontiella desulfatans]|uniref:Chaperone SurA n=2 Tax=Pontiella desulfatans TaxID=2750659 RepID=A0A6C2U2V9_PONDE|nr:Chaperone SurA [Pontiella desulfatans]